MKGISMTTINQGLGYRYMRMEIFILEIIVRIKSMVKAHSFGLA